MTPVQKQIRSALYNGLSTYKDIAGYAGCDSTYAWQYIYDNSELYSMLIDNKKQSKIRKAKAEYNRGLELISKGVRTKNIPSCAKYYRAKKILVEAGLL